VESKILIEQRENRFAFGQLEQIEKYQCALTAHKKAIATKQKSLMTKSETRNFRKSGESQPLILARPSFTFP
jgi:hypothetical protein